MNPFLNVDWRKRFWSGAIDVRAGYTYEEDFNSEGEKLGNPTSRSYVLAKGLFAISDNWDWGFTAERASDPLIFDRYGVADPFEERGLYSADGPAILLGPDGGQRRRSGLGLPHTGAALAGQGARRDAPRPAFAPIVTPKASISFSSATSGPACDSTMVDLKQAAIRLPADATPEQIATATASLEASAPR